MAHGWPRYVTVFDLVANALAYVPLGFLWVAAVRVRGSLPVAFISAVGLGCGFSLLIETVQNYLPSRVPSNLDWATNSGGTLLGAGLALLWGRQWVDGGRWHAWRQQRFLRGPHGDAGLALVGLWLLTQVNPETFLFGNGNLRGLLGLPAALPYAAERTLALEMTAIAAQTLSIALIGARLAAQRPWLLALGLLAAALTIKSAALLLLMRGASGLAWATPGSLGGLAFGVLLWLATLALPPAAGRVLAAPALMLAAVLANLMPDNPYLENTLRTWQQGHFLNFNGATRLATALWPYLALPWLMLSTRRMP